MNKQHIWIRFHLGAGANFGKWRVEDKAAGRVEFLDPDRVQLVIHNGTLSNQPNAAAKIFTGLTSKAPIAWVKAESLEILAGASLAVEEASWVRYNPRIAPNWQDTAGHNIDHTFYPQLITEGRRVFINAT